LSSLDKVANFLVFILLMEMMVASGLSVKLSDLKEVVSDGRLLIRAGIANYIVVPTLAVVLLFLFQAKPLVSIGFLLLAVCPAAPFAPPLTAMAKGSVTVAVGLMVILGASSAVLAPLLLSLLIPLMASGTNLRIDGTKIVSTLLFSQIAPLGVGLLIRAKAPKFANTLQKPASICTGLLSVIAFGLLISAQYQTLADIRWKSAAGISLLLALCLAAGWISGGGTRATRRAVALTTAARNVGVALVIATTSFPDSAAVTAVVVFAIFQTIGLALIAGWIGRSPLTNPAT
jgi:BASS family bile acid:Na+ symporter